MTNYQVAAIIITLAAGLSYFNARVLRLPSAIGLMASAMLGTLVVITLDRLGITHLTPAFTQLIDKFDLSQTLLHGMLGALLFAGALHVDLDDLRQYRIPIGAFALLGTPLSTAIVGVASYFLLQLVGIELPLIYCLLFGSLISPTDPIAVLGILKAAKAPKSLEVTITGESLFNDGVGVVIFLVLLGIATGGDASGGEIVWLFVQEAIGGLLFGLAVGYVGFRLLRSIDQYSVEILITLAMVLGGYAAAESLHVSAPIAAVASGLLIGNHGRSFAMSEATREHLDTFWELVDEILNAVLFLLMGLEILHLTVDGATALAAFMMIPLVLLARLAAVGLPLAAMPKYRVAVPGAVTLLTWGGLRGGISIALALSLPVGPSREVVLVITYGVVAFSILIQGMTLGAVARRLAR